MQNQSFDQGTCKPVASSSQVVSSTGARIFVRDWTQPDQNGHADTCVLFVHGWAVHCDFWQYQMAYLSSHGVRCVAYDRRGHGRSEDTDGRYDIDTLADDLSQIIEHLNLTKITLVGHSMGCGEIVRYITRQGSGRIARIIFVAPSLPYGRRAEDNPEGMDDATLAAILSAMQTNLPTYLDGAAQLFFKLDTPTALRDWGVNMCYAASLRALVGAQLSDVNTDFRQELKHIHLPTLIVHGDEDRMAPLNATAQRVNDLIPRSRLEIIEGGPHGVPLTDVEVVNQILYRFIVAPSVPA